MIKNLWIQDTGLLPTGKLVNPKRRRKLRPGLKPEKKNTMKFIDKANSFSVNKCLKSCLCIYSSHSLDRSKVLKL